MNLKNKTSKLKKYKGGAHANKNNDRLEDMIVLFHKLHELNTTKNNNLPDITELQKMGTFEEIRKILIQIRDQKDGNNPYINENLKNLSRHVELITDTPNRTYKVNDPDRPATAHALGQLAARYARTAPTSAAAALDDLDLDDDAFQKRSQLYRLAKPDNGLGKVPSGDKAAARPAATRPAATRPAATRPAATRPASARVPSSKVGGSNLLAGQVLRYSVDNGSGEGPPGRTNRRNSLNRNPGKGNGLELQKRIDIRKEKEKKRLANISGPTQDFQESQLRDRPLAESLVRGVSRTRVDNAAMKNSFGKRKIIHSSVERIGPVVNIDDGSEL